MTPLHSPDRENTPTILKSECSHPPSTQHIHKYGRESRLCGRHSGMLYLFPFLILNDIESHNHLDRSLVSLAYNVPNFESGNEDRRRYQFRRRIQKASATDRHIDVPDLSDLLGNPVRI